MRQKLVKFLGMQKGETITVSPNKNNIRFTVLKASPTLDCFDWLVTLILNEKERTPFTIIFCQTVNDIVTVLSYLLGKLGTSGMYVNMNGDTLLPEHCLVGVYYSQTPNKHKDLITNSFESNGNVRVAIASSSLGMGVDFPCVTYVIHFGPSRTLSEHLQMAGRVGRDGSQSYSLTVFVPKHLIHCDKQVRKVVKCALNSCARMALVKSFDEDIIPVNPLHNCCSFCYKQCECSGEGKCSIPKPVFDNLPEHKEVYGIQCRNVNSEDRVCVKDALRELQVSLSFRSNMSVLGATADKPYEFSDGCLKQIVDNVENISTITDVLMYCPSASYRLAVVILEVLMEVFEDIDISDEIYCISAVCPFLDDMIQASPAQTDCMDDELFYEDSIPSDYSSDELSQE